MSEDKKISSLKLEYKEVIKKRIEQLENIYGSLRAVARGLDIDKAYLSRLKNGIKSNPSDAVLSKLGLI